VRAHHWYALLLDSTLRGDQAILEMQTAVALAPSSITLNSDLGMVLWHQRRFAEAILQLEKTVAMNPTYADAHNELAAAYLHSGEFDRAIATFRRAGELGTIPGRVLFHTAFAHAEAGRLDEARAIAQRMRSDPALFNNASPSMRGQLRLAIREYDGALDEVLEDPEMFDANLLIGQLWRPFRRDPRFHELVRRHGFFELAEQNAVFRMRLEELIGPLPPASH
jgi:tetratricopeptide (TPR) repeat protein